MIKLPVPVRGVRSWEMVECVLNGDFSDPTALDDRKTKMTVLSGGELVPVPVSGFTFGN
ncbi:MAG: hypothetical protein IPP91_12545 [Betaproteobacteria bacterium]|nr:hypothetical protein [Betaproteobacteria bacterium]